MAIRRSDVADFVRAIKRGKFVHIEFVKANGEFRKATVQFGVVNPANVTAPGKGVRKGVSFEDALEQGVIKFYEPNKINENGTRGAYRSARIDTLVSITSNGVKHQII